MRLSPLARKNSKQRRKASASARPEPAHAAAVSLSSAGEWPWYAIAAGGLVVTGILLGAGVAGDLPFCDSGSGCDLVQASAWSRFLGLPLALWGFGAYLLLLLVAAGVRNRGTRNRWLAGLATLGFVTSVYLTAVSALVIEAFCAYCLVSAALMTAAFGLSFAPRFRAGDRTAHGSGLVAGLALAAGMHVAAVGLAGAGPIDPTLRALAEHLDARGAKFYGASWCPHCQEQKEVFGAAAKYLPYVECSPNGRQGPPATECVVKEIRRFPTWIIDGRRIERLLPAPALMKITAFTPPKQAAAE